MTNSIHKQVDSFFDSHSYIAEYAKITANFVLHTISWKLVQKFSLKSLDAIKGNEFTKTFGHEHMLGIQTAAAIIASVPGFAKDYLLGTDPEDTVIGALFSFGVNLQSPKVSPLAYNHIKSMAVLVASTYELYEPIFQNYDYYIAGNAHAFDKTEVIGQVGHAEL